MNSFDYLFWIINGLVLIHISAGCTAFASVLVPLFTKKGHQLHKRMGKFFTNSILISGSSIVLVVILQLSFNLKQKGVELVGAKFLMICALSAICSVMHGRQAIKYKDRTTRCLRPIPLLVFAITILGAAHVCLEGDKVESVAIFWFSILIIGVHGHQLWYWFQEPSYSMHWWPAHMDGMLTGFNAIVSGFALRTVTENYSLSWSHGATHTWLFWFLPSMIILPASYAWLYWYKRKLSNTAFQQAV